MAWLWNFISGFTSTAISHTRHCNGGRHLVAVSSRQVKPEVKVGLSQGWRQVENKFKTFTLIWQSTAY